MPSTMLSESRNDDFWMASGMMERNDARASAPDPPTVYYSVTDESGVNRPEPVEFPSQNSLIEMPYH